MSSSSESLAWLHEVNELRHRHAHVRKNIMNMLDDNLDLLDVLGPSYQVEGEKGFLETLDYLIRVSKRPKLSHHGANSKSTLLRACARIFQQASPFLPVVLVDIVLSYAFVRTKWLLTLTLEPLDRKYGIWDDAFTSIDGSENASLENGGTMELCNVSDQATHPFVRPNYFLPACEDTTCALVIRPFVKGDVMLHWKDTDRALMVQLSLDGSNEKQANCLFSTGICLRRFEDHDNDTDYYEHLFQEVGPYSKPTNELALASAYVQFADVPHYHDLTSVKLAPYPSGTVWYHKNPAGYEIQAIVIYVKQFKT